MLTALLIITGVTAMVTIGLTRSMTDLLATNHSVSSQQTWYTAEAGLDQGKKALLDDLGDKEFNNSGAFPFTGSLGPPGGSYAVDAVVVSSNGASLDSAVFRLTATGTAPSGEQRIAVSDVQIINPWRFALYDPGNQSTIRSDWHIFQNDRSLIDLYDTAVGDYGAGNQYGMALMGSGIEQTKPGPGNPDPSVFLFAGPSGAKAGKAGGPPPLQMQLYTDVQTNTGDLNDTKITGNVNFHGQRQNLAYKLNNLDTPVPDGCPKDQTDWIGDYTLDADLTMGSATLCFKGTLTVKNATLKFTGATWIVLASTATVVIDNGHIIAATDSSTGAITPGNLIVEALAPTNASNKTAITMTENSTLYAGVYMPSRDLLMNVEAGANTGTMAQIFGAVVANHMEGGNNDGGAFSLHQDNSIWGLPLSQTLCVYEIPASP